MPSESRRPRSVSRSPPPLRYSEKRRDDSDDDVKPVSREKTDRFANEHRERRRDEEGRESKRRKSRYNDEDPRHDARRGQGSSREGYSDHRRDRSRSRSRSPKREDRSYQRDSYSSKEREESRIEPQNNRSGRVSGALPSQSSALAAAGVPEGKKYNKKSSRSPSPSAEAIEASKPNFSNSGALAAETNTFKGVVLKYNEPPEARKPSKGWRLYVFKGKEQVDMIHVNRQSAYLFGRDKVVVDIPIEHPSASKQHAVLQYRQVHERNEFGDTKSVTKPYLIDLESANGTTVNEEKIPASRYYELQPNDLIKFAYSTREYVLIVD